MDRDGELEGRRAVREDWLEPMTEDGYRAAVAALRDSDWPGLAGDG